MKNRAFRSEPRYEITQLIPLKEQRSLLEWLRDNNRLIPRDTSSSPSHEKLTSETVDRDSEEIADFIEESSYGIDHEEIGEEI